MMFPKTYLLSGSRDSVHARTWSEACSLRLLVFTSFIRASEFSKLQTNFAGSFKSAADFPAEVYEMRKYKVSLQQSKVKKCSLDCTFTAYKVLIQ